MVVEGDGPLQSAVLEDLSDARNYRRWIADLVARHLGDDPIEVGSGNGDMAAELAGTAQQVTATEGDPQRLAGLRSRFAGHDLIRIRELTLPSTDTGQHSAVFAVNVLEHIPDDVEALRSMSRLVRPGGRVVLFVPAFQVAFSRFDHRIGHQRRYTIASLEAALRHAHLQPIEMRYVNLPGLLAWIVGMRLLRLQPRSGPLLRFWDRVVVPLTRRLERFRPPFGQSVFAVARTSR